MKSIKGLLSLMTCALLGGVMVSCNNDLRNPSMNGNGSLSGPVKTPDVVVWSGNETFRNTFTGNGSTGTRAENANANEWADPNKEYGGWLVPDPLTEGQKLRAKAYFQAHPNLAYEDPHWHNFFVQQVYKGYTKPGIYSPEIYTSANGSTTSTSDNMNLMTVGQGNVHINNFNGGTCEVNNNVLDNGGNVNDGPFHSDQIMLMVDIDDTSCFGYHETNGSKHHNDKAALVSAAVIDAWAAENGNIGEPVVDKWNRSFLGFDLELQIVSDIQTSTSVKYWDIPGQPDYILKDGKYIQISDKSAELLFNNLPIYYLGTNSNQYFGETKEFQDNDFTGEYRDINNNNQYLGKYVDIDFIYNLLNEGWLPASGGAFKKWIKVVGGDGYYSDWIVCVTEAHKIGENPGVNPNPETPEVTEGVCENCGHGIFWNETLGMFVHVNMAANSSECQDCIKEGKTGDNACDNPVLHDDSHGIPDGDEKCGKCKHSAHNPGECQDCQTNHGACYVPNYSDNLKWENEVEINLSILDVHKLPNGNKKYDIDDLVSKLSIHVRYPKDVEVILPVPANIYCDQDDLYILKDHYFDKDGNPNWKYGGDVVEYAQLVGDEVVTLNVEFVTADEDKLTESGAGYIRIWTTGINENVIKYCRENFGDGINFEVYNYYNRGNKYTTGNYPTVSEEELQYNYLSHSIVNFDWKKDFDSKTYPYFYINAFNQINDQPVKGDCYVWILGDSRANIGNVYKSNGYVDGSKTSLNDSQRIKYVDPYQGTHFNGSPLNWIYTLESLPGAQGSNDMPATDWPFGSPNKQYFRNVVNGVSNNNFSF